MLIGGSQAGLAVGYYVKHGLPFVILDENERIVDAWRKRWDSWRSIEKRRNPRCSRRPTDASGG